MIKTTVFFCVVLGLVLSAHAAPVGEMDQGSNAPPAEPDPNAIRVGMLVYGQGQTAQCFSTGFLRTVARRAGIPVQGHFDAVPLDNEKIYEYPFLILSGTGVFELSEDQAEALKAYVARGGFLLASAGCSNELWAHGFEALMGQIFPQTPLKPLELAHPLFHTLFDIERLPTKKPGQPARILGMEIGGRLAVVYCPTGLNDSDNAGGGCCCCGGNEVRNARWVNANILMYVLTH